MGSPYLPIEFSRLGPVDLAYEGGNNNLAFGLGPCSQMTKIFGRHQNQCWGEMPSQWLAQSDSSMACMFENKLSNLSAYYTKPRTNTATAASGLSQAQVYNVRAQSSGPPPCGSYYSGITAPQCPNM